MDTAVVQQNFSSKREFEDVDILQKQRETVLVLNNKQKSENRKLSMLYDSVSIYKHYSVQ